MIKMAAPVASAPAELAPQKFSGKGKHGRELGCPAIIITGKRNGQDAVRRRSYAFLQGLPCVAKSRVNPRNIR
jgi:hypothetical protein